MADHFLDRVLQQNYECTGLVFLASASDIPKGGGQGRLWILLSFWPSLLVKVSLNSLIHPSIISYTS